MSASIELGTYVMVAMGKVRQSDPDTNHGVRYWREEGRFTTENGLNHNSQKNILVLATKQAIPKAQAR